MFRFIAKDHVQLKPYARDILDYCKATFDAVGLGSSAPNVRGYKMLEHFEISKYFDHILFAQDVKHNKPHPEVYLKHLDYHQVDADEALVIEDSIVGAQAANNAGIGVILVPDNEFPKSSEPRPDNVLLEVDNLNEVIKWMKD
ncbi:MULTISPECIES: HAD family hydrolase [Aerococcus]|uniref:HAD family hydrolase n=2 Tax=Bacillati TaxID=1783272 RepID=A0ABZ2EFR0_9LACT|nr:MULTISPECIES: HAD family hydrolase [Aerococcus]KAA9290488.1 HAD family hydrolase [Aerococcus mictus]PKY81554.1 hypothetical protein CYJ31_08480 [Aerococcus mictus]PMB92832.1 hypothetical protein CK795_08730 [Aerococcus mictus]RAV62031.1 HAD family hydrolase [Aerococcus mictus]RAV70301.1 HAD family hydrolase [Aerococcus mictus]